MTSVLNLPDPAVDAGLILPAKLAIQKFDRFELAGRYLMIAHANGNSRAVLAQMNRAVSCELEFLDTSVGFLKDELPKVPMSPIAAASVVVVQEFEAFHYASLVYLVTSLRRLPNADAAAAAVNGFITLKKSIEDLRKLVTIDLSTDPDTPTNPIQ